MCFYIQVFWSEAFGFCLSIYSFCVPWIPKLVWVIYSDEWNSHLANGYNYSFFFIVVFNTFIHSLHGIICICQRQWSQICCFSSISRNVSNINVSLLRKKKSLYVEMFLCVFFSVFRPTVTQSWMIPCVLYRFYCFHACENSGSFMKVDSYSLLLFFSAVIVITNFILR